MAGMMRLFLLLIRLNLARCRVHLIDGDHRLNSSLDQINKLFLSFLEELTKFYASK
jgi:hypothetical protein